MEVFGNMKKLVSILIILTLVLASTITVMAAENNYHCNADGGNGRVWPDELTEDGIAICPKCGSAVWVAFSGGPNNIQYNHGVAEEEVEEPYIVSETVDDFSWGYVAENLGNKFNVITITVTETIKRVWSNGFIDYYDVETVESFGGLNNQLNDVKFAVESIFTDTNGAAATYRFNALGNFNNTLTVTLIP